MDDNGNLRIKEQDLVLKVSNNVDVKVWDESDFYDFLNELCGNRTFQKDAILTALRFMCGGQYQNTKQLAYENFNENEEIRKKFINFSNFEKQLFFTNNYTATLDLATGTGKSWVMYGIAAIMLSLKIVKQVLVLVPSVTIEEELTKKFKSFAMNNTFNTQLKCTPPKIINGSESIVSGCICIENRDAIYNNTRSSIIDSLSSKGAETLVLSDEAHHIYYSEENQWKSFIEKINFKYNIGLSGTCYYRDNNYFSDVIYRYSLRQAIEECRVKSVEYVVESNIPVKKEDKWQVIINSHNEIKNKYKCLPLTLIVNPNINSCKKNAAEFKKYLKEFHNLDDSEVNEKVLVIHSKSDATDRINLKCVDNPDSKVEWIFSVSMLTEGWDVKRVFQIVPDEEKAFNSKLLIAQVLGRGLRVPNNWNTAEYGLPKVIVFNHAKWASSVKKLVDEVLEIERKISSYVIEDSEYNFDLYNVNYSSEKTTIKTEKVGNYNLFENGYIVLPTDIDSETITTDFIDLNNNNRSWNTMINHKVYSVDEMAELMWHRFEDIPDDRNENLCEKYQKEWTIERLKAMIELSLQKSSNTKITDKIRQRFLSALGVIFRQGNAVVDYKTIPDNFEIISTNKLRKDYVSASALRRDKVVFWNSETEQYLTEDEKEFFKEIIDTTNPYKQLEIRNIFDYKSPQTLVIADSGPEKDFLRKLFESRNENIKKWIKSTSSGFYSIEYSWRKGEHPQRNTFNPDFFICFKNRVLIVETKSDDQINNPDAENIGKYKAARNHFDTINDYFVKNKIDMKYKFTMLTPKNFEVFFNKLKSEDVAEIDNYNSELDVTLIEILQEKHFA